MTNKDKDNLLKLLAESYSAVREAVADIDPHMRIYKDTETGTDWRVRDIVGHIETWDSEVAKSLCAYRVGTEYVIPGWDENEDDFNQQAVLTQRALTTERLYAQWEKTHGDFKKTVQEMPDDRFPGDLLYPWGDERGTIAYLVEYMTNHRIEHRDEIMRAVKEAGKTP